MATVDEIYNEMAAATGWETELDSLTGKGDTATQYKADLSNQSIVGRNRLMMRLVSYAMYAQRVLWDIFRTEVKELALDGHYGTARWFVAKALEFQFGDNLVFTPKDAFYNPVNTSNRIVAQAACVELGYTVVVKAARLVSGSLVALTDNQRIALQDYFDELRPPIVVQVRSAESDKVRMKATVVTDAKIGTSTISNNVQQAINNYFGKLQFNGALRLTDLRQAILSVPGVIDLVIGSLEVRSNASATWTLVNRVHVTFAGYAAVDSAFPLSSTLSFVSSNV